MEYALFAGVLVLGAFLLCWGVTTDRDNWDLVGILLGHFLIIGGAASCAGYGVHESEQDRCLTTIAELTNEETRWVDGECFVKRGDKFVPLEWIEGYDRD